MQMRLDESGQDRAGRMIEHPGARADERLQVGT